MMKKMMVLYNETSGSSESKEIAERFKKLQKREEAVILQPSNPDIDPEEMRKNAKENQVGVLVVIGGDGPFIMPFKILKTPFVTIK